MHYPAIMFMIIFYKWCHVNAYLLHPSGFIKQEEISDLLKQVETDYEVCVPTMGVACSVLCCVYPLQPRRTMAHTTYRFDRKLK